MKEFFNRLLTPRTQSKDEAKQRLKVLLIHDQVDLTPAQIEQMRAEIMEVVGRYVEYEEEHCRVSLERHDNKIALVSTVPVRRTLERATA